MAGLSPSVKDVLLWIGTSIVVSASIMWFVVSLHMSTVHKDSVSKELFKATMDQVEEARKSNTDAIKDLNKNMQDLLHVIIRELRQQGKNK